MPAYCYYTSQSYQISEEVWEHVLKVHALHRLRHRLENFELLLSILLDIHYGREVIAPVAVVGSRPHSHQVLILEPMNVAFLN